MSRRGVSLVELEEAFALQRRRFVDCIMREGSDCKVAVWSIDDINDDDVKYKIEINRRTVRDTKIAEALAARQRPLSSRISYYK